MPKNFNLRLETEGNEATLIAELDLDATPEQVWSAISDGEEIQRWFALQARSEPGEGGIGQDFPQTTVSRLPTATLRAASAGWLQSGLRNAAAHGPARMSARQCGHSPYLQLRCHRRSRGVHRRLSIRDRLLRDAYP